jgi:hypothetical protein
MLRDAKVGKIRTANVLFNGFRPFVGTAERDEEEGKQASSVDHYRN